ncbi:MAG TPA: hypothetical protein VNO50_12715, partial [Pyrinomonadaceae bacterium]|nr:hypothetical protein [Pyrinomonadaceae bacterium]
SFREGQMQLLAPDFLPLCAHELRVLLATPNRSGLQQVVTGPASPAVSPLSGECPNRVDRLPLPTLPSADFCAAIGLPHGFPQFQFGTQRRPPEVSSTAFTAHLPDLHPRTFDGYGLRG